MSDCEGFVWGILAGFISVYQGEGLVWSPWGRCVGRLESIGRPDGTRPDRVSHPRSSRCPYHRDFSPAPSQARLQPATQATCRPGLPSSCATGSRPGRRAGLLRSRAPASRATSCRRTELPLPPAGARPASPSAGPNVSSPPGHLSFCRLSPRRQALTETRGMDRKAWPGSSSHGRLPIA